MLDAEDKKYIQNLIETHQHTGTESFKVGGESSGFSRSYHTTMYAGNSSTVPITCGFRPKIIIINAIANGTSNESRSHSVCSVTEGGLFSYSTIEHSSIRSEFSGSLCFVIFGSSISDRIHGYFQTVSATGINLRIDRIGGTVAGLLNILILG